MKKQKKVLDKTLITFFKNLGLHLMDTYLIVLMSIQEICEAQIEVKEDNLVRELHKIVIKMHE